MKRKSKLMRASGVLLVLTLITSSLVGGTFAKYVSEGEGTDTARVAKWGVVVTGAGDAFANAYATDDESVKDTIGISVQSTQAVVAPGTSGEFKGISLSGTPEVAVNIATTATVQLTGDWENENGDFYCPLVFDLNGVTVDGKTYTTADDLETALKSKIESAANGNVAAGVNLADPEAADDVPALLEKNDDGSSKIKWSWPFEGNDTADTHLGNIAAGTVSEKSIPNIEITLDTTVTQID